MTQLQSARKGLVTNEMIRTAKRIGAQALNNFFGSSLDDRAAK